VKYLAKIRYLGTDFHGFQVQPSERTVQGELCRALKEATGVICKVTGCSRTDAGVHANEFCITVEGDFTVPADKLPVAVARFLPTDLSLFYAENCDAEFHPRYDVISKEYLYKIKNEKVYDPFYYGRAWFLPREITDEQIDNMKTASKYILGKQDFSAFMSPGSDVEDTVRTVFYVDIQKNGSEIDIKICADGFLYNMVRIIVGTLIEVAYGRIKPDDIKLIIESKDRKRAGMTAPPDGLYLNKVSY
jgi:tRNA pseudouridine38-40 synthase